MEQEKVLRPVYRCRLCGELFQSRMKWTEDEAWDVLVSHSYGDELPCVEQPRLFDVHQCEGMYAGSLGLADLLGYRNVNHEVTDG